MVVVELDVQLLADLVELGAAWSSVMTARASGSVSRTDAGSSTPARSASMRKKPMSKEALCAQTTYPRQKSASLGMTSAMRGASATMSSVMPWT